MSRQAVVVLLVAVGFSGAVIWLLHAAIGPVPERKAITAAVERYLQAQAAGDMEAVYRLLPPSSEYRRTHSLEQFQADVARQAGPVLRSYRIVRIGDLRANADSGLYPHAEKLVTVEVEVTFKHTGADTVYNYSFTFLRENGAWYKG